jgi:kojibiose phosphorylase
VLTGDLQGHEQAVKDGRRHFGELRKLDYDAARRSHTAAVGRFWEDADVEIQGDDEAQRAVRYALWATRCAAGDDGGASSLGAKNLSGDWYRGAVFWDLEMFQLPLLAAVAPERARNHIRYRARRLDAARALAAQDGYQGARFPWQSYRSGLEEPPAIGGFLYQQQHLNAAVAWGVLHYYALTRDTKLMFACGLELLLELCRYWASRVEGPDAGGAYHLRGVCGPDEVHQGVTDNAYTNRMVIYVLCETERVIRELVRVNRQRVRALLAKTGVDQPARRRWKEIAARLHVPRLAGSRAFAQFAGFEQCREPDEETGSEGGLGQDKTNKQADALLLFQALPEEFDEDLLAACWREYAPLCNQTSSLSLCTHATLAARLGLARDARRYFRAAAGVDLADQLGNTGHGLHGAGEGGVWLAAVHGFGGLRVSRRGVALHPALPPFWKSLRYRFFLEGQRLEVQVTARQATVTHGGRRPVRLKLSGRAVTLRPAQTVSFRSAHRAARQDVEGVITSLDVLLDYRQFPPRPGASDPWELLTAEHVRPGARELLLALRAAVYLGAVGRGASPASRRTRA